METRSHNSHVDNRRSRYRFGESLVVQYRRPWMYPKQIEAIFNDSRISLVEASTKSGKTVGCMFWLTEEAMKGGKGNNFWWVAPSIPQAEIAYKRLKNGLPPQLYKANEIHKSITLVNGSCITFRTGEKPDLLYGEDVHAVVIDEASRLREEAWVAIRSTIAAVQGRVRIIGNVKGRRNWFYKLARRAESGDRPDRSYHKITWRDAVDAGILEESEVRDAQADMPDEVWKELFEAEPSHDAGNPFGIEHIRKSISPISDRSPAVWGWDLAKSVDWTVGIALDDFGVVCGLERFQHRPWPDIQAAILTATGTTPALMDSTGVGDPIVDALQREGGLNFQGFQFTSTSKQRLMETLAVAIQSRTVKFPEGPLVRELEHFEYEYHRNGVRYSAPSGLHDDCVCALALAVYIQSRPMPVWGVAETSADNQAYRDGFVPIARAGI